MDFRQGRQSPDVSILAGSDNGFGGYNYDIAPLKKPRKNAGLLYTQ